MLTFTGYPVGLSVHFVIDAEGANGAAALLPTVQIHGDLRRVGAEGGRERARHDGHVAFRAGGDRVARPARTDRVVRRQINLVARATPQVLEQKRNVQLITSRVQERERESRTSS